MVFPWKKRLKKQIESTDKTEKTSSTSKFFRIPEKCRRYGLSLTRDREKPKQRGNNDSPSPYKPNLNAINIPSHRLFESRENILRDYPLSTRGSRENIPENQAQPSSKPKSASGYRFPERPATPKASPALPSTPTRIPHHPHDPPTPSTPTKPILKPHTPCSSHYTSPEHTHANTTRNLHLTSNGSPRPMTLKRRLLNVQRRCYSLPAPSLLPASWDRGVRRGVDRGNGMNTKVLEFEDEGEGKEDKEMPLKKETVKLEPLPEDETGSEPGTPTPTPAGTQKKSVRFDRVEINTFYVPGFRRRNKKGKGSKKKRKVKRDSRARNGNNGDEDVKRVREAWRRRRHSTGHDESQGYYR